MFKAFGRRVGALCESRVLTKSNLFVESNAGGGLLGLEFLGVKEYAVLLLESLLSLNISHLR